MLVAMNALSIVYRELAALPVEDDAEQRELARAIRAGDVPPGMLRRVKADVEARLRDRVAGVSREVPLSRQAATRSRPSRDLVAARQNALSPVSARPISSFWIWLVPS